MTPKCSCELEGSWQTIVRVDRDCVYHGDAARLAHRKAYLQTQIKALQWELNELNAR